MVEVMIIRPEKEVGMGCCGGICSDPEAFIHMDDEFKHHDDDRQRLGYLYQKTEQEYGEQVDVMFFDPRNLLAIALYFWKQGRWGRIRWLQALSHFVLHIRYNAIFINGHLVMNEGEYEKELKATMQD